MLNKSKSENAYQIFIHIAVGIIVCASIFPLLYVLGMSLTTLGEMQRRNFFVIIPMEPTIEAYKRLLITDYIWRSLGVSIFRSLIGTLLLLCLTMTGAYVLARKSLPGRKFFLFFILVTVLFNGGMIPTYLVVKQLGLTNSVWSLIIPMLVDSFGLLAIKVFIENLPDEIIEAARIDGTGDFQLLIRIVFPLTIPSLAAIGMFNAVIHWNNWFDAMLYITNKTYYPFQLIIRNMFSSGMSSLDSALTMKASQRVSAETLRMAAVIFGIIPILCVYPFLQKHFSKGMFIGSIKG
ncbi:MAG: carbohydrate ABC transporter permease [Clostridia bacterium]|nr:carbohydrate ABC transporter permease [Clostridia bacterium]